MTRFKRLDTTTAAGYAEKITTDKELRQELQSASKHAVALVRGVRSSAKRSGRVDVISSLRSRDLQEHAAGLLGSVEKAVRLLDGKQSHRGRTALVTVLAGVGAAGLAAVAAKSISGER